MNITFELLENHIRKKIIIEFLKNKGTLTYEQVKELVINDTNRPDYHLGLLVENYYLQRIKGKGNYKINEKIIQPLREFLKIKAPICLIGGFGIEPSLFIDIIDALTQLSIIPKKYILITSPEAKSKFFKIKNQSEIKIKIDIKEFDYMSILRENYEKIHQEIENIVIKEIMKYNLICELTGGTKPITIALMKIAEEYHLNRIYFSGKKILWL